MVCRRCGSEHVNIQSYTETKTKSRGCFGWLLWILLAIATCGLILLIPLLTNYKTKSKTRPEAVCQNCGHHWRV